MNLRSRVLELVRNMDDDELWAFLQPLLLDGAVVSPAAAMSVKRGPGRPKKIIDKGGNEDEAPPKRKPGRPKKDAAEAAPAASSNGASDLHKAIVKFVKKGNGCAVSEVATKVGQDKAKVAAALKALVAAGQIAKAGERRFTRYAADLKAAKAASMAARGK